MDSLIDEVENINIEFGGEFDFFTPNEKTLFIVPLYQGEPIKIIGKNKLDVIRKGYRYLDGLNNN